jgi:ferrochelatase
MPRPARREAAPSAAVVLINLGTPESTAVADVKNFLREMLSDPRLIDLPAFLRRLLVDGILLKLRAKKVAEAYAAVWTPEGSPLRVHTARMAARLRATLARPESAGSPIAVDYAMRYGNPSIPSVLEKLKDAGSRRILLFPLYPQYSTTTTRSLLDACLAWAERTPDPPERVVLERYADDPRYIAALAESVRRFWEARGRPGETPRLLMSFHGIPCRRIEEGDPYADECRRTARLLADALGLADEEWRLAYQSRFGPGKWLEPRVETTIASLAKGGMKRLDVLCPGFAADCLETLGEIARHGKKVFLESGGEEFNAIPCLNEDAAWVEAMAAIAGERLDDRKRSSAPAQRD